jgi:hypothetical protein
MPAGGALISGAVGLGKSLISADKLAKDNEEISKLKAPFYKIQDEYFQNRDIAANNAESGLSAAEKNYALTNNERGLSAGISAILQGGGSPSSVASLNSIFTDSNNALAAEDAKKHLENIQYFMGANKDLAGQKTTQWGVNEYQKYQNKLKELTERKSADETSIWNGVNDIVGSVGAGAMWNLNKDLYDKLFSSNNAPENNDAANKAYQQWSNNETMNNAPQYNGQPTSGKFAPDNRPKSFNIPDDYLINLLPPNFLNRPI